MGRVGAEIVIAKNCGFCVGVRRAVELVEKALTEYAPQPVYSLGMFIHNELEIERLKKKGLKVVSAIDELPPGSLLLLSSHGSPPEIVQKCRQRQLKTIDLMCTYVRRLQEIVKSLADQGFDIVMLGDKSHPEVRAICSLVNKVIVIDKQDVLNDNLNLNFVKYGIVSQTTQSFWLYKRAIKSLLGSAFPKKEVRVYNTICRDVMERQEEARCLAQDCDVVFVLGGKKSANTYRLFEIARQLTQTYQITYLDEFNPEMIKGKRRVGILSGTSTPDWFVEKFIELLNNYKRKGG